MLTKQQCQKKLFTIGIKLGVSPKLISTRLLSSDDKNDMLSGLINDDSLATAVEVWIEAGMPDYANGNTAPYRPSNDLPMNRYRGMGESG